MKGGPGGEGIGGRMALNGPGLVKLPSEDLRIHSGRLDKKVSDQGTVVVRIDKRGTDAHVVQSSDWRGCGRRTV